jgi:choline dehydrogenase
LSVFIYFFPCLFLSFVDIIVGAGLAGVTVAARLAENSALSILVVEAGGDDRTNELIYDIHQYSKVFGNPQFDWAWPTDQGKVIHGYVPGYSAFAI